MARTDIAITEQPHQGSTDVTAAYSSADAANNMKFDNDGNTLLVVEVGATTTQVTVQGVPDEAGRDGTEQVSATNSTLIFGPFNPSWWNTSSEIHVDFDQDTDVNVAALRL